MALVTCYDAEGNPHQKEPVDARECVANCGYSMNPPNGDAAQPSEAQLIADEKVREAAKSAQTAIPTQEKRPYSRKAKE
ncbi:MAG: hypothetical protein WA191_06830 [Telluria sp.]